ncbi:MAG: rhodanese-like domain-containing protein [Phycisphaeraceae bacterium]
MQRLAAPLLLTLALAALGGCAWWETRTSDQDLLLLTTKQVKQMLAEKEGTLLLDVRPAEQYAAEHLPGAINIHLPELVSDDPRLAHAKQIVVYAGGEEDFYSPAGAKTLLRESYSNVYDYRGGIEEWVAEGNATVKGGAVEE